MSGYATLCIDPPWRQEGGPPWASSAASRPLPYPTMAVTEIAALPVEALAAEDAHLYLWVTNRYLEESYRIARGWGFRPVTLLTWCKAPMGLGLGGAFVQTTEHVLFARRGADVRLGRVDTTWWRWSRGEHSAKPDAFLDLVEQVSPAPRAELFARRARFGWSYPWGDEVLGGAAV